MAKKKRKRAAGAGRPPLTGEDAPGQSTQVRASVGFLARLDKWRAKQEGKPTRAEALRTAMLDRLKVDGF